MVVCTLDDPASTATVMDLKKTWAMFWEHGDRTLFDLLPVFQKP